MARLDPITGELRVRIAYVGHPWAGFERCAARIVRARGDGEPTDPIRLMTAVSMSELRPAGLTCRGRRVCVELLGISRAVDLPESPMRAMLRDVSGIVHTVRGVTHWLEQFVEYQDVLNRALSFWQYDIERIPQICQIDRRYCACCGESFVDGALRTPLLNPWGAREMWCEPLGGEGVLDIFDACLERALARAERHIGPPFTDEPRPVEPDAMARRAFALVDAADRAEWLPADARARLIERAARDAQTLPIVG